MLRVLSAQSADEPAPLAPGDPHRLHFATLPRSRGLAPEEPPTLSIRPTSSVAPVPARSRMLAQGPPRIGVGSTELPEPERRDQREGAGHVPGVAVLDQLLELGADRRGQLGLRTGGRTGPPEELSHRVRPARELVVVPKPIEERRFFGGEAHSEEAGRGSRRSGGSHAFYTNLTSISKLCGLVKQRAPRRPRAPTPRPPGTVSGGDRVLTNGPGHDDPGGPSADVRAAGARLRGLRPASRRPAHRHRSDRAAG
jgi:hypothetical protein